MNPHTEPPMHGPSERHAELLKLLPEARRWPERPTRADLALLPAAPAVFLWLAAGDAPIQLATAQDLRHAATVRLHPELDPAAPPIRTRRADLGEVARGLAWRPVDCAFEARLWFYRLARRLHPARYRRLISFGPAYFLHVDASAAVPEIAVSERVWGAAGAFVGPWATQKAAREALEALWDLFDLCRYPEQVRRLPHGTRCAYADMGRCDSPCDGSVPPESYAARCRAAWELAARGPAAWIEAARQRMRDAAMQQRYELAGQIKNQVAVAERWGGRDGPPIVDGERMRYVLLLRAARRRAWRPMLFDRGLLVEGPLLREREAAVVGAGWLAGQATDPSVEPADIRMEQTWLVFQLMARGRSASVEWFDWPAVDPTAAIEAALRRAADLRAARPRRATDGEG